MGYWIQQVDGTFIKKKPNGETIMYSPILDRFITNIKFDKPKNEKDVKKTRRYNDSQSDSLIPF